jgi:FMN phosphatase YigB (HAD superfamily)
MTLPRGSIHAISFDYGHVLGALDLSELSERLGGVDENALLAAEPAAYRAHDAAIANGLGHERAWRALMTTLVVAAGVAGDVEEIVRRLWAAQPARNLWRFVPVEARALLDDLTARKVPMVITSNSEGRIAELLAEVGIVHHFSAVLDSGLLGFAKPDPRIFRRAAASLSLPENHIVHIGDSEPADIVGARAVGMHAIRYDGFVPGNAGLPTCGDACVTTFDKLREALLVGLDR